MIIPEPTSGRFDFRYSFPSDEGLQTKFLYRIVEIPEMGAAGHLGVVEERCALAHASEHPDAEITLPCPNCRAAL